MSNPSKTTRQHLNLQDLFARAVRVESGCIEWQMARNLDGYGKIFIGKQNKTVSRLVLSLVAGEPKSKQVAMHLCDNPPCINPDHLRWGTEKENMQDASSKNRLPNQKGMANRVARLTDEQVAFIRNSTDKTTVLMQFLPVKRDQINKIRRGGRWSHI